MNIVEAYIKFKGQFIILISGLPGCGKLNIAKSLSKDFKFKLLDQYNYYKKDYNEMSTLQDGTKVINWYNDNAIDWDKLKDDIEKDKKKGVIVVGISFPQDKIRGDYHVHLTMSKQMCMDKRKEFLEKHKDENKYDQEYKILNTPTEKLIMNQLIFPYYLEARKNSKIDKWINMDTIESEDDVYDIVFNHMLDIVKTYLAEHDKQIISEKTAKVTKDTETCPETISSSIELLDEPRESYDRNTDMIEEYFMKPEDFDEGDGPVKLGYPDAEDDD